jgi:hypothetical protein
VGATIHPWEVWFSKPSVRIKRGKQFTCQPHSMAVQVRNAAKLRGLRVSVLIQESVLAITVLNFRKRKCQGR